MNTQLSLFIASIFLLIPFAFSADCSVSLVEEKKFLSMSYDAFDQTENGWRQYAKLGCYHEMGVLIDKYVVLNKTRLANWQTIGVTWHAGQMYSFNNEYGIAKIRFEQSINPNEPENTPILWNDYVYATIAFLNNDMLKLKLHRDRIANGPVFNGKKSNLDVVDNLIRYFRQPYSTAYRSNH
ncbi:MAG: hypothetical protein KIT56_01715 [Gammaproteobacteria bacterium]|nr:hypothetical protein [Gammaproteobacteria bacterium]MCW5582601.1 hypothetical protein [Gammaproteobacteria bacterium]